ncbi:MAG: hypothetical protein NTX61_09935 [Bacteroidetes bacterium]|nr:hypothetical protein [Bacteroidota bacterium]
MKLNVQIQRMNLLRFIIMLCLAFSVTGYLCAATHILGSTTMKILSGTTVTEMSNLLLDNGGILDNQGTVTVKGNLSNTNTSSSNLGTGTYIFGGTTAQTISGPNVFTNVTISNSGGVSLIGSYDNTINGVLTLNSGQLALGTLNLLLGTAATVAGTPSAGSMVVPTGTGELRKSFAGISSFTYPVGDNDGTAEYSPVTTNFTSGTFPVGNYLGVTLKNLPDPDVNLQANLHLNRYWSFKNNTISGYSCGLTLTFTDADVVGGVKADLVCIKSSPVLETYDAYTSLNHLTGTVTDFSRFTGARAGLTSNFFAFLEGATDGAGGMTTILPTFTSAFPTSQPYSGLPWSYSGTESKNPIPAGVVDWVYLELRQATDPSLANASTIFARRAAFLKSDGSIVDLNGTDSLRFYNAGYNHSNNVYLVVKHRNHLAIMSNNPVTSNLSGVYTYDFTDAGTKSYGYPNGIKLVHGKWSLIGGNGNADALVNTDDLSGSFNTQYGLTGGYFSGDFNMNGSVNTDDLSAIFNPNYGVTGGVGDHYSFIWQSMVP